MTKAVKDGMASADKPAPPDAGEVSESAEFAGEGESGHADEVQFSLGRFEALVYTRDREGAAREITRLLEMLNRNYGTLDQGFEAYATAPLIGVDPDAHILNRICCALTALFADPEFDLSAVGARQLFVLHRWISALFAASAFGNADHILRALNLHGPNAAKVQIKQEQTVKFCLLYTPNSEIPLDMNALWDFDKNLAISLACALLSPRFLGTESAHHKREILLPWLTAHLDRIEDLDVLPLGILHDIYMHCSYADLPQRHAIKAPINRLVRKKLQELGLTDVVPKKKPRMRGKNEKPVMLVVLEWFSASHSIYRTHSASLRAARKRFKVIGIGQKGLVDEAGQAVFDEYLEFEGSNVRFVRDAAQRLRPDLVYYPAIGMFPTTIFLTNLRLAPIQVSSYGHPATSMSPFIDYFVLPEDWVGDPKCFIEKLLPLPKAAMPFVPSAASIDVTPNLRTSPKTMRIAVAATTMKLNPGFMRALAQIQVAAPRPVQFQFFIGFARGLSYLEVKQFIQVYLPDAVIHSQLPYADYMAAMNECDMYLNPFPFGNTNGIVDVATIGLVGVCKTGREVLEKIDEALFERLGMPQWLVAKTEDEYVKAALRLIEDEPTRLSLRRRLLESHAVATLYTGEPELFGDALANLCRPR